MPTFFICLHPHKQTKKNIFIGFILNKNTASRIALHIKVCNALFHI